MSAISYLQINIIPMIAMVIMRINTRHTLSYSWRNRALRFIMVLLVIIMFWNSAAWMLEGQTFSGAGVLLWVCNLAYFATLEFMAFLWALYARDILLNGSGQRGRDVIIPALPLFFCLIALFSSPWTHLIFYIDEQNRYVRGSGFLLHSAMTMWYVFGSAVRALWHCRKAETADRRLECRWLAYFAIFPVISGILQVCFYGVDLLLPFTAISILMVYINVQQRQVTRDSLTGLNNRRRLEQHMRELEARKCDGKPCYLIMMDVDLFKKINDTYGHVTGDEVLKLIAEQMKRIFGDSKSFLARYGGDEFVVIIRERSKLQVEEDIQTLKDAVAKMEWGPGKPWELSISVGCAGYSEICVHGMASLARRADERMYEEKRRNR